MYGILDQLRIFSNSYSSDSQPAQKKGFWYLWMPTIMTLYTVFTEKNKLIRLLS